MPFTGPSRAPQILAGNIIPMVVATVFTFARIWSRAVILKVWGLDDTMVVIAWIFALALIVANCIGTAFGQGHHAVDVPDDAAIPLGIISYTTSIFYTMALSLTKISICLFYLRLFTDRRSKYLIWGTMTTVLAYTIPCIFLTIFACTPVAGSWDASLNAKCVNNLPIFWTLVVANIAIDIWLIALVAQKIRKLQLAKKQKIALLSVITMGWLVVVAALIRLGRTLRIINDVTLGIDSTWFAYDTSIWSATEVCVGIFCATAPSVKPFLRKYAPGLLSTLASSLERGGVTCTAHGRSNHTALHDDGIELENRDQIPILESGQRPGTRGLADDKNSIHGYARPYS
ncbi:hypothetical protein BP6252_00502 [Coleophoma cylindrospora]|uniref:Rhodopsin domain-containing protein n=1 Tax=Coleophoma cylindrospora TaxID=1849047 RepID=A0A3D8SQ69_9HELO|nr:hypothetical protein BP6252_00502 [Coleophoma cylindrospora]